MEKIKNHELLEIVGGLSITGTLLSAISKGINTILELGRSLGSAIRRGLDGNYCGL